MAVDTPNPTPQRPLRSVYEEKADMWMHALANFAAVSKNIFSPEINLRNPEHLRKFATVLGPSNGQLSTIAQLVEGDFADLGALATVILSEVNKTRPPRIDHHQNAPNEPNAAAKGNEPKTHFTYADVLQKRLPKQQPPKPSRLPSISAQTDSNAEPFNPETFELSKKGRNRIYRAAVNTIGYEAKKFALVQTSAADLPMKNPFNFTRCLSEAGIREPFTLLTTTDPRKFLLFGPESGIDLIQPAYERFQSIAVRHCDIKRFPSISVSPVADLLDLCGSTNASQDLVHLLQKLRDEIQRLESPSTVWRPRLYFAEALREHEQYCYETHKQHNPTTELAPLKPRQRQSRATALPQTDQEHNRENPEEVGDSSTPMELARSTAPCTSHLNVIPQGATQIPRPSTNAPVPVANRFNPLQDAQAGLTVPHHIDTPAVN